MTIDQIPTFVISLRETDERREACRKRLTEQGVKFQFYLGINGPKAGLTTVHKYSHDHPDTEYRIDAKHVGLCLSHFGVWSAIAAAIDQGWTDAPAFMICEDDADFHADWKTRVNDALATIPDDWEMLYPGSCSCGDTVRNPSCGKDIYRAVPLCTHCYIVRRESVHKLIKTQDRVFAPIDISLYFATFPTTYVYAILPRCVDQILNPGQVMLP